MKRCFKIPFLLIILPFEYTLLFFRSTIVRVNYRCCHTGVNKIGGRIENSNKTMVSPTKKERSDRINLSFLSFFG